MNNNRSFLKKFAVIAAFAISAIVCLPETLFAKGGVIGYVYGFTYVSDAQLDHLTHIMAVDLYIDEQGNVFPNPELTDNDPSWTSNWLGDLVERAHQKGVKVSIVIAEGIDHNTGVEYYNFSSVTADVNLRNNLVSSIANFVDLHELDGVSIDWEYPEDEYEWAYCIAFLNQLKSHSLLQCKRISIALSGDWPDDYPGSDIPKDIWTAVDAIHLMTYDMPSAIPGVYHSDVTKSISSINAWGNYGNSQIPVLDKEKLFLACAFYGYNINPDGSWGGHIQYQPDGAGITCDNPGDNATVSIPAKVNHCYSQGYGGVFFWELAYDVAIGSSTLPSLLKAIWDSTNPPNNNGYSIITITTQPAPSTTFTQGNISGSLSVSASTGSCVNELNYQWYSNTTNSNSGGTVIMGATNASFAIPTGLTAGTYYYFCEIKSGKSIIRSGVATVIVTSPKISGANDIQCKVSEQYSLSGVPYVAWSISSSSFEVYPLTGLSTTVKRTGSGSGTLIAKDINGNTIDSKSFSSCSTQTYSISPATGSGQTDVNHCGALIIQNVTVNSGATLNVVSCGDITINNVIVVDGGNLILDAVGEVVINEIDVQLGAGFEIK